MKKLVISVKKWLRGVNTESTLRNKNGCMCCLGFLARDCGASVKDIFDKGTPMEALSVNWPKDLLENHNYTDDNDSVWDSSLTSQIVSVNDDKNLSLKEKQSELKRLFLKIGYRLTFK